MHDSSGGEAEKGVVRGTEGAAAENGREGHRVSAETRPANRTRRSGYDARRRRRKETPDRRHASTVTGRDP